MSCLVECMFQHHSNSSSSMSTQFFSKRSPQQDIRCVTWDVARACNQLQAHQLQHQLLVS